MLERLESVFASAGIPHVNQSAYRRAVSCADAIFATQEVVARYLRGGSRVYMCLYDLQKAFDSVEYPVLLEKLYNAGVNGKMWRLLKSWYTRGSCQVKLDGMLSQSFHVKRGVKQVLSPALFLLVMDPLLKQLQTSGLMTEVLWEKLEAFQGELAKRILKWSKPLQHCCCHYPGGLDNALQSVDQEAEFPPACREQQLCQPERYSPACLER